MGGAVASAEAALGPGWDGCCGGNPVPLSSVSFGLPTAPADIVVVAAPPPPSWSVSIATRSHTEWPMRASAARLTDWLSARRPGGHRPHRYVGVAQHVTKGVQKFV